MSSLSSVRRWYPLSLVFLAVGLSSAMVFPFRALFLTDAVHADPALVTIFLIVTPISAVLASSLLGGLSDRRPIRRWLVVGSALAGLTGCLVTAFVRNYWVLLLVTATIVALSMAIQPQLFAYARAALNATEPPGSHRSAMTISALRTVFSIAWVAGPFIAALLLDSGGFELVYGVAAAMYTLSALIALLALPEPPPPAPTPGIQAGITAVPEVPDAPGRAIWLSVAGLVLLQCSATLGVQALPLFVTNDLGGNVRESGLILGLCAGLEVPLMLGFGALAARMPLRRLFLIGPVLSTAYFATAALSHHTALVFWAQLLNAGGIALIQGIGITYFQDMLPRQPGRGSTLFSNAFPIGSTLGAPLLGVAQQYGYRFAYVSAAVLSAGGLILLVTARPGTGSRRRARSTSVAAAASATIPATMPAVSGQPPARQPISTTAPNRLGPA